MPIATRSGADRARSRHQGSTPGAAEGPPLPVAIVLLLVDNDRAKLDRVADKLAIKWRARWSNLMRG
jgi:hypothetical protein